MKKSIVAASIALALGVSANASAAFLAANSTYTVDVSGGCFAFGDCTALAQNVGTGSFTLTTDATGANFTVGSYSGIAFTATPGGLFETGGTVAGLGAVSDAGQLDLNFTGRTGTAQYFPQYAGAAWNIDNCTKAGCTGTTGVYEGFTTGSDSNVDPTTGATALTLAGSGLVATASGWTGLPCVEVPDKEVGAMPASLATSRRLSVSKLRPEASSAAAASSSFCRVSAFCCCLETFRSALAMAGLGPFVHEGVAF